LKIFNTKVIVNDATKKVYTSKIDKISEADSKFLMKFIVEIISGKVSYEEQDDILDTIIKRFDRKAGENNEHGYIAELLACCILRDNGFSQEYCFKNLEESSLKKGFDGIFLWKKELYILESKSSYSIDKHHNKHALTIGRAYKDVDDKFTTGTVNNPWENAVNHARVFGSKESLIKQLTGLSRQWRNGDFGNKKEKNIILASTIFSESIFEEALDYEYINEVTENHNFKNEIILLNELKSKDIIINYFREKKNG
jgi:hypothetical protein